MSSTALPGIIQGGMGIGVSSWRLARAVSLRGHLGVVSCTAIDSLFVRRLQDGDVGGHLRRAMAAFPLRDVADEALRKYFLPDGRPEGTPYRMLSMYRQGATRAREQLTMLASFVEVWLAREGHSGPVGINLLTKVQLPNLAALYGAMLAGVRYVLMGAGIPREIPGVLDALARHARATLRLDVEGLAAGETAEAVLDPAGHCGGQLPPAAERPEMFQFIKEFNNFANVKVLKETKSATGATLEVEGITPEDKKKATATVEVLREGGAWKIGRESWKQ